MTQRYANTTTVSPDRSKAEIENLLRRYGADQFIYGWREQQALIGFSIRGFQIRISLPLPDPEGFNHTPAKGQRRSDSAAAKAYQQAERQAWRALVLVIKAKLEAAEAGITTIEEQFLADMVLPDNTTLSQRLLPELRQSIDSGKLPPMLPGN